MEEFAYRDVSDQRRTLIEAAEEALKTAYRPYSGFSVGCALLFDDGSVVGGSNVENASYGAAICAERTALVTASVQGKTALRAAAIVGPRDGGGSITGPCGICRQFLIESSQRADYDTEIIMCNGARDKVIVASISELLPLAFGPKNLGLDIVSLR